MKFFQKVLYWYSLLFSLLFIILGIVFAVYKNNWIALIAFGLTIFYFLFRRFFIFSFLKNILIFYNLALVFILMAANFGRSTNLIQFSFGFFFVPLALFYWLQAANLVSSIQFTICFPVFSPKLPQSPSPSSMPIPATVSSHLTSSNAVSDTNRRQFLKLVGGTSVGLIALSLLNPQKAGATFFGSTPGPGTISIKDSSGNKIDPAAKQPTDGYKISQIDDISSPSYYGYVNQTGQWYIMKEDTDGAYRYARDVSGFSANWAVRSTLAYDYFDIVF